ncbi:MAG: hypothetical protein NTV34_21695 [Proteobacteria bacterium]|nr:hypothetical protein [Pseudomonadota bacterium]
MNFSRIANWVFSFGLLGWAVCTFITPYVIKVLFTPPVSFGTNCEPAAAWSMNKLIMTQVVGIVVFMVLGVFLCFYYQKSKKQSAEVEPSNTQSR